MFRKTETMSISEFLHGKETPVRKVHPGMFTALPLGLVGGHMAFASGGATVINGPAVAVAGSATKQSIMHAFDPLIQTITTLSFPIAGVMITGGALMWMIGLKDKGMGFVTNACIGFILIQMSPMFLDILYGIAASI